MPSSGWIRRTRASDSSSVDLGGRHRQVRRAPELPWRTSVTRSGRRLPVRTKSGTPAHRQLSTSRRMATYVSVVLTAGRRRPRRGSRRISSPEPATGVLAADRVGRPVVGSRIACEQLHLLVADRLGVERARRLHEREGEHLQHVVLHDVAHGAGGLVEAAACADAEGLGHGDLHVVDLAAVPDRLEDRVGEPEGEEVLHRLLAEVVVDAEDVCVSSKTRVHVVVEDRGCWRGRGRTASR